MPSYRIAAAPIASGDSLKAEFYRAGPLQGILLRYTQALLTQMALTAVCNRHHRLDQQLCRWLLLIQDRLPTDELLVTQKMIANMLGVRREGVTASACKLQKAGLISYHRGHISILDRPGLEARACGCYATVKKEYDRLLSYHRPRSRGENDRCLFKSENLISAQKSSVGILANH